MGSGSAGRVSDKIERFVEARLRDVGGVQVRRLLPSRASRTVGPFVFFDHMGPHTLAPGSGVDVPPHPHIHLATVTYLFEGELLHRDSLGSQQIIRPGDINWMHAGSGIVHSERTTPGQREAESRLEGVQLWVALPEALEETPPRFEHYSETDLPVWTEEGIRARVLAGKAFGCFSPVKISSGTLYVDAALEPGGRLHVPDAEERCVYLVRGSVAVGGSALEASRLAILRRGTEPVITAVGASRVLILGGDPLDGERHVWWNFVSSSRERIEQAKLDWSEGRFPLVPGDEDERVPLPG